MEVFEQLATCTVITHGTGFRHDREWDAYLFKIVFGVTVNVCLAIMLKTKNTSLSFRPWVVASSAWFAWTSTHSHVPLHAVALQVCGRSRQGISRLFWLRLGGGNDRRLGSKDSLPLCAPQWGRLVPHRPQGRQGWMQPLLERCGQLRRSSRVSCKRGLSRRLAALDSHQGVCDSHGRVCHGHRPFDGHRDLPAHLRGRPVHRSPGTQQRSADGLACSLSGEHSYL